MLRRGVWRDRVIGQGSVGRWAGVEEFGDRPGGGANIPTLMNLDQVGTSGFKLTET